MLMWHKDSQGLETSRMGATHELLRSGGVAFGDFFYEETHNILADDADVGGAELDIGEVALGEFFYESVSQTYSIFVDDADPEFTSKLLDNPENIRCQFVGLSPKKCKTVLNLELSNIRCQFVGLCPEECKKTLIEELGTLQSLYRVTPVSKPNAASGSAPCPPQQMGNEGQGGDYRSILAGYYQSASASARAAGARSGPMALCMFSCTERGSIAFGTDMKESEVLGSEQPFIGAYVGGELGPVAGAHCKWVVSDWTNPVVDHGDIGAPPAPLREVNGGALQMSQKCDMQGFTSVYAALGQWHYCLEASAESSPPVSFAPDHLPDSSTYRICNSVPNMEDPIQLPAELRSFKPLVEGYVWARIRQFAREFARRLNANLSAEQLEKMVGETVSEVSHNEQAGPVRTLRLVLRHDCQSTGCGDGGCLLCQYNPSRLCKRNLKNKYLIEDHLKANFIYFIGTSTGKSVRTIRYCRMPVHVLNGEKYREICPDNTLLSHAQLKTCVISHHQKALLRREGGSEDALRCFLPLERGQAPLSDLAVTTSSEALLAGKAPTFRLLVWAKDSAGEPVPNVTYVVSESFVRVKHAIKSDIPSIDDHVSKMVHIGKATVEKLQDLRAAAAEEGFEINVPDDLNCVDRVGNFQRIVHLSEMNADLKNKVRHLLKLSPEKWEEVSQHALAAVVPDFRPRVWWSSTMKVGLLFQCKNGSVSMEHPHALVKMATVPGQEDQPVLLQNLDHILFNHIPKLKQEAIQSWKEVQQEPQALMNSQQIMHSHGHNTNTHPMGQALHVPGNTSNPNSQSLNGLGGYSMLDNDMGGGNGTMMDPSYGSLGGTSMMMGGGGGGGERFDLNTSSAQARSMGPPPPLALPQPPTLPKPPQTSPFAITSRRAAETLPLTSGSGGQVGQPPRTGEPSGSAGGTLKSKKSESPFSAYSSMDAIAASFKQWPGQQQQQQQQQQGAAFNNQGMALADGDKQTSLDGLDLPGFERGTSQLWESLPSFLNAMPNKSQDWGALQAPSLGAPMDSNQLRQGLHSFNQPGGGLGKFVSDRSLEEEEDDQEGSGQGQKRNASQAGLDWMNQSSDRRE
eukprot:gene15740-21861_t